MQASAAQEMQALPEPAGTLAGDAHRAGATQLRVRFHRFVRHRRLEPVQSKLSQRAGAFERCRQIPAQAHVNEQVGVVASSLPRGAHQLDVIAQVGAKATPAELHRRVAFPAQTFGGAPHRIEVGRILWKEHAGVCAQAAAEKIRLAVRRAADCRTGGARAAMDG